jgi:hypothetical protein
MHVEDRRTQMLLPVLGHADTKHVVQNPVVPIIIAYENFDIQ